MFKKEKELIKEIKEADKATQSLIGIVGTSLVMGLAMGIHCGILVLLCTVIFFKFSVELILGMTKG